MGYTRFIRSGNQIEIYSYNKNYVPKRKRNYQRNKRRKVDVNQTNSRIFFRSEASIQRARNNFFRLVQANLPRTKKITFITFTAFEKLELTFGYKCLRLFFKNVEHKTKKKISYIVVPEWQQRGALHFHAIVWGLNESDVQKERITRNFQRQWARGFVDVFTSTHITDGISGYMVKYLSKALGSENLTNKRGFSSGGELLKPQSHSSNTLSYDLDLLVPDTVDIVSESRYNVPYMGQCTYKKLTII